MVYRHSLFIASHCSCRSQCAHASTLTHPPLPTLSKPCRHPGCPVAAAAPKNGVSTTDDGGHGITVPSVTEYIIPLYLCFCSILLSYTPRRTAIPREDSGPLLYKMITRIYCMHFPRKGYGNIAHYELKGLIVFHLPHMPGSPLLCVYA